MAFPIPIPTNTHPRWDGDHPAGTHTSNKAHPQDRAASSLQDPLPQPQLVEQHRSLGHHEVWSTPQHPHTQIKLVWVPEGLSEIFGLFCSLAHTQNERWKPNAKDKPCICKHLLFHKINFTSDSNTFQSLASSGECMRCFPWEKQKDKLLKNSINLRNLLSLEIIKYRTVKRF